MRLVDSGHSVRATTGEGVRDKPGRYVLTLTLADGVETPLIYSDVPDFLRSIRDSERPSLYGRRYRILDTHGDLEVIE